MSTPPPETPPSAAAQAKADAGSIAVDIAKGAATGGWAGAAMGALKGAAKTKTGRKFLLALPLVPVTMFAAILGVASSVTATTGSLTAGHDTLAQTVAATAFTDPNQLRSIQDAAIRTGVRWEVLGAIIKVESARAADKGAGPFGIDLPATSGGISAGDAKNLELSALYMGRQLADASVGTINTLNNPALDAGAVDTVKNGTTVRTLSSDPNLSKAQDDVHKQYDAALIQLPIKGNPQVAEDIFQYAQAWSLGQNAPSGDCSAGGVTLGGQTNVALDDQQKQYAQHIINKASSMGLPERAAVVALATALQESRLQMYWNPRVDGSQALSNGGPEGGKDYAGSMSVGLFQQQVDGDKYSWGTVNDAMDPEKSAGMFLNALTRISGWQDLDVAVAAQDVQGSAYPDAYAQWQDEAEQLVHDLKPTTGTSTASASPSESPSPSDGASPTPAPGSTAAPVASSSGCASGVGTGIAGKGDDYPFRDPVGVFTTEADPWSLYKRQCVSFVAWRINEQMGWKPGQDYPFTPAKMGLDLFGSAVDWKNTVGSKFTMDMTPKVGAVVWWDANVTFPGTITGPSGHVAIVSAVNGDGTIDLEEYNFKPLAYDSRRIPAKDVSGYIHVADLPSSSTGASPSASPSASSTGS